jgi:hypothetical protein
MVVNHKYFLSGAECAEIIASGLKVSTETHSSHVPLVLLSVFVLCLIGIILYKKRQTVATMMNDLVISKRIFARGTYSSETERCIVEGDEDAVL